MYEEIDPNLRKDDSWDSALTINNELFIYTCSEVCYWGSIYRACYWGSIYRACLMTIIFSQPDIQNLVPPDEIKWNRMFFVISLINKISVVLDCLDNSIVIEAYSVQLNNVVH